MLTNDPHWKSLRLLTFYRLILTGFLAVLHFSLPDINPFDAQPGGVFSPALLAYLTMSLIFGFTARLHWPSYTLQTLLQLLIDIFLVIILVHTTGGISSSLTVLMIVTAIAGALLLPGRIAFLLSAIATLAVLGESGYNILTLEQPATGIITQAGFLGMVLFTATGLAYFLATRARESEALAEQRGIDLENLEQINRHIIQHLQFGVLVVDPGNIVRMSNATANTLLNAKKTTGGNLKDFSPDLEKQQQHWTADHSWQPENLQTADPNHYLIPRFSEIATSHGTGTIIFLDDSTTLAQQAQQIKLASLGRLSASIAHEIRNPLGAISHAAQLLDESENIEKSDRRLVEIIGDHVQRVDSTIESVLQLSRRNPVQRQTLTMSHWLDNFIHDFNYASQLDSAVIQSTVNPETLSLETDPGHLHQILWNLVKNAVRHAADPALVTIKAYQIGNNCVIDVIDNGPGISAESADKIFEPFYTTESGGTGLGLYLARTLCEINHSKLSYLLDDKISCFRIHFSKDGSADY